MYRGLSSQKPVVLKAKGTATRNSQCLNLSKNLCFPTYDVSGGWPSSWECRRILSPTPTWWEEETAYHSAGVGYAGDAGGASLQPLSHTFPLMEGGAEVVMGFLNPWYFSCRDSVEFSRSSLYFFSSAFHIEASSTEGPCSSLHLWVGVYFQRRAVFTRPTEECGFISKKTAHFKLTVNIDI